MSDEDIFYSISFSSISKIARDIQKRIDEKLRFYILQKNPLQFVEPLKDSRFGNWRFRIGDYRILFDVEEDKIIILKVGHRKDVYR
ncbi:MAG: type II toxin-antitoxin system mRNA interferase toxin, RelE/StbE family [Candidatus Nealsonbacteria bacterium CG08_land_8_20_14_0_20_38_20]|uniref:Type II toxin-antitoxin system mRNA interferase toxin, RelE/StbE family n=1 Tax=Candidatus Nealsonbacteria bacterium CG08_land_8_20_14_0_20_38_20 TaxID=1974705 RepID=A0A2H0YLR5_9BACT|nr:MAG: type II toxin-antitoxin system mRNA interferase toxin, RelE/StbE family [Candidatus Nealsonbacteria bacterium CG08_land_8_20_14_0_20_38_20]